MTKLKEYRLKNKMTLREVANFLGVSESAVNHYESGKREPNMDKLKLLAILFNCKIDDLID